MAEGVMRRRYTDEEKRRFVNEVRAGASVKEVAGRRGVDVSMGYRWLQGARDAAVPKFARAVRAGSSSLAVEVGGAVVRVAPGFDAELLREVVSALSSAGR